MWFKEDGNSYSVRNAKGRVVYTNPPRPESTTAMLNSTIKNIERKKLPNTKRCRISGLREESSPESKESLCFFSL
jgi:hypothetical protein